MSYIEFPYTELGGCVVVLPMANSQKTTLGFGGKGIVDSPKAKLKFVFEGDEKERIWEEFYNTTLNYGTSSFLMALPIFGRVADINNPKVLVRFYTLDREDNKESNVWRTDREVTVIGYIEDVEGLYPSINLYPSTSLYPSQSGEGLIETRKEITYGI